MRPRLRVHASLWLRASRHRPPPPPPPHSRTPSARPQPPSSLPSQSPSPSPSRSRGFSSSAGSVAHVGYSPSLIPVKRTEAESAFEAFVKAEVPVATIPVGSANFVAGLVDLLVANSVVDRKKFNLIETIGIRELCEGKGGSQVPSGEADRLMINISNAHLYDDAALELAIERAESFVYPKGYGFISTTFAEESSKPIELLKKLCILSQKNRNTDDSPGFSAIQCPLNIFETSIIEEREGQPSLLATARSFGLEVYADNVLHSSPLYSDDPVSFMSDPPGAAAAMTAAEMEIGPLNQRNDENWSKLADSIKKSFNTALGLEKRYEEMREKASGNLSLPESADLAWAQIIIANRDELQNCLKWEFAKRSTIIPKVDAAIGRLQDKSSFENWGTTYMRVIMNLLDLFSASVHWQESKTREQMQIFFRDHIRDDSFGNGVEMDNLRLEDICVSLLRCSGVDTLLTDNLGVLRVANAKPNLEAKDALQIMKEAREHYYEHILPMRDREGVLEADS